MGQRGACLALPSIRVILRFEESEAGLGEGSPMGELNILAWPASPWRTDGLSVCRGR